MEGEAKNGSTGRAKGGHMDDPYTYGGRAHFGQSTPTGTPTQTGPTTGRLQISAEMRVWRGTKRYNTFVIVSEHKRRNDD